MHDSKKLLDQAKRQLASSTNTPTEAGPTASKPLPDKSAVIDAINRMFAEFELVYHNQYNKAFANAEKLSYAKKLWFSNLCHIPPEQITAACHRAIRESEFLPTIKGILKYCEPDDQALGLPDPHSAYVEACRAPSPKNEYRWSHPAVYHAGRKSDWYFLANNTEQQAFPVYKRHYQALCEQVRNGHTLHPPHPEALPAPEAKPLEPEEQRRRMREMRSKLNI
ncbi:replication protein P [Spongiibacter marinus]|uniref:replication protein P n=1 Tax=Spongiibacter marinus TaxID=354246 RepID=UPI003568AED6